MTDLLTTHPEVNLIYSEASGQTVGTMAALTQAGRGKFDNGKPLTEIVSSVDFDEVEIQAGLRSQQLAQAVHGSAPDRDLPRPHRPDHGRCEWQSAIRPHEPAEEFFYKAYNVSYWTMPQADAANLAQHPVRNQRQVIHTIRSI